MIEVIKRPNHRITVGLGEICDLPPDLFSSPAMEILAFDLELSGRFDPIVAEPDPATGWAIWSARGAEAFVELEGEVNSFRVRVRSAFTRSVLYKGSYPEGGESPRQALHRFADEMTELITGHRGFAQTRVLCAWDPGDGVGKRVVLMDSDGDGMTELTGEEVLELSPRWAADCKSVVYTSYASGWPDVYLHNLEREQRDRIAHYEGLNDCGELSPGGQSVVLTLSQGGNPEIYIKDLTSLRLRRLTDHRCTDTSPTWSPDGARIAFVSDRSGGPQIYTTDVRGSSPKRLTTRGSYNTAPDWSPDGRRIAFCGRGPNGPVIQVLELETGEVWTAAEGSACEDPSWSPDGNSILYSRRYFGKQSREGEPGVERTDLFVTHLNDGRALRIKHPPGRFTTPDWSPFPSGFKEESR
jgi:TolB protein